MTETPLLSDLCATCYSAKPKYRCPRCKTQTCSLPCYKRHQHQASCNGQRDPAAYLKRRDWATPQGIDHDYNYLKSVERRVDSAGRDVGARGIGAHSHAHAHAQSSSSRGAANARLPEGGFKRYLRENGIEVEYAPRGMSRQKANRTRATKSKLIFWTVEWVEEGGERGVQHDCLESRALGELYEGLRTERRNAARRRGEAGQGPEEERAVKRVRREKGDEAGGQADEGANAGSIERDAPSDKAQLPGSNDNPAPTSTTSPRHPVTQPQPPSPNLFFYLSLPHTATRTPIIAPLPSDATLTSALRNRTLQEFPTIHVLSHPPENLPAGYMLESDYKGTVRAEDRELEAAVEAGEAEVEGRSGAGPGAAGKGREGEGEVDAEGILAMLRRDVGG